MLLKNKFLAITSERGLKKTMSGKFEFLHQGELNRHFKAVMESGLVTEMSQAEQPKQPETFVVHYLDNKVNN